MGKCPHCGSKNIRRRYREHGRYKWRCRSCNRVFRRPKRSIVLWLGVIVAVAVAAAFFAVQQGIIVLPSTPAQLEESVKRAVKAVVPTATLGRKATRTPERVAEQTAAPTPKVTSTPTNPRSNFFKSAGDASRASRESRPQIDIEELEALTHRLINAERTKRGLHALEHDRALSVIARNHSLDMAQNDYFSHDNLKGQDPTDRGRMANYDCVKDYGSYYSVGLAENLFQGGLWSSITYMNGVPLHDWFTLDEIAFAAIEGWMNSKGHTENILDTSYDRMGIGVAIADDIAIAEDGEVYFTQVFC